MAPKLADRVIVGKARAMVLGQVSQLATLRKVTASGGQSARHLVPRVGLAVTPYSGPNAAPDTKLRTAGSIRRH